MIKDEELNESEWALSQIIAHPVLFREFINQGDVNWEPLEDHERAWSTCTSRNICMCCGRSVHKTTSLIEMLYYWMINEKFIPGDPGLFVLVPNKAQKDLTFYRIRSACSKHWLIKQFVNNNSINMSEGKIEFVNGFQFLIRLSGEAGKESNVIGLHTYRIWVDEAQDIPWRTWLSLQNCFKEEISGCQFFTSGVPNGLRTQNVLFETDSDEKYNSFNIAQTMMRWWNPKREYEARKQYHALLEDTEDYKHYVLGQHGAPTFIVFDRLRFSLIDYETQKFVITKTLLDKVRDKSADGTVSYRINELILAPPVPAEYGKTPLIGMGYDVGFSPDPGVILILYHDDDAKDWRILARYVMEKTEYAIQRQILAWLDDTYGFSFIGIDMGGPGKVQYQDLTGELSEYKSYKFLERIFPVEFGGYMVVAIDEEGNEKKDQTKRVAVETLSRWAHEHRLVFALNDDDILEELERTKFSRTITGEPVYRTDNDHQMAALMCAIMAYENKFGPAIKPIKEEIKVKLLSARWLDRTAHGVAQW